jgi:predicted CXXCH cytochrome family protein
LAGQEKNEKCLPCHTTGHGDGGHGTPGLEIDLTGVQCEACHGPAWEHVSKMDKASIIGKPSATVCARCHMEANIHARP